MRILKSLKNASTMGLAVVFTLLPSVASAQWDQRGDDIDGWQDYSLFGSSVSLTSDVPIGQHHTATRVAIGVPLENTSNGTASGRVEVYEWVDPDWENNVGLIDGEAAGDESGTSVSMSSDGTRVAIGAPFNDGNGDDSGHVRVYEVPLIGPQFQLGSDIDGEAPGDFSGWSVSLSSDGARVAIGATSNHGNGDYSGHVRVYEWVSPDWIQVGSDIDGESEGNESGWSVSLSSDGTRVAIGAPGNDDGSGHVRVYEWVGPDWIQVGSDIDGESEFDGSGRSVSLSSNGTRVAIGAPGNDDGGFQAGQVRVYEWVAPGWVQMGADIDGDSEDDTSGWSVSLTSDGSHVAIGAPYSGGVGENAGHVRVYQWDGQNWTQLDSDIDSEALGDESGTSVSMSSDGTRVAIGAPRNDGSGITTGHVRVYTNFRLLFEDDFESGNTERWSAVVPSF